MLYLPEVEFYKLADVYGDLEVFAAAGATADDIWLVHPVCFRTEHPYDRLSNRSGKLA